VLIFSKLITVNQNQDNETADVQRSAIPF